MIETGIQAYLDYKDNLFAAAETRDFELYFSGLDAMRQVLSMPEAARLQLAQVLHGQEEHTVSGLASIAKDALESTEVKLKTVGLQVPDYLQAYHSLNVGDETVFLRIAERSEAAMDRYSGESTFERMRRDPDFRDLARSIHAQILQKELGSPVLPEKRRFMVFAGATGSGKTENARAFLNDAAGSIVNMDLDVYRESLMDGYHMDPWSQRDIERVKRELWGLGDEVAAGAFALGKSLSCQMSLARTNWLEDDALRMAKEGGYETEIVYVLRPLSSSLARFVMREGRCVALKDFYAGLKGLRALPRLAGDERIHRITVLDYTDIVERETGVRCQTGWSEYQEVLKLPSLYPGRMAIKTMPQDIHILHVETL